MDEELPSPCKLMLSRWWSAPLLSETYSVAKCIISKIQSLMHGIFATIWVHITYSFYDLIGWSCRVGRAYKLSWSDIAATCWNHICLEKYGRCWEILIHSLPLCCSITGNYWTRYPWTHFHARVEAKPGLMWCLWQYTQCPGTNPTCAPQYDCRKPLSMLIAPTLSLSLLLILLLLLIGSR